MLRLIGTYDPKTESYAVRLVQSPPFDYLKRARSDEEIEAILKEKDAVRD